MPVIDRMITAKHDPSPRRKWCWETSRLKCTETKGEVQLAEIFPLTSTETFWFITLTCQQNCPFENIQLQFMCQGHDAKDVYINSLMS